MLGPNFAALKKTKASISDSQLTFYKRFLPSDSSTSAISCISEQLFLDYKVFVNISGSRSPLALTLPAQIGSWSSESGFLSRHGSISFGNLESLSMVRMFD